MTKRSPIAEEIAQGLQEILAYEQGKISLNTHKAQIPSPPKEYQPEQIREVRVRLGYSQAFFARIIGVSADSVRSWEQGLRSPSRAAARVLEFLDEPGLLEEFVGLSASVKGGPGSRSGKGYRKTSRRPSV